MSKKMLLIDFDGVMVDTLNVCFRTSNEVWGKLPMEEYKKLFEGNLYKSLGIESHGFTDKENLFFELYEPRMLQASLVGGIAGVVERLKEKYVLVIISSSVNSPVEEWLKKHAMLPLFDKVFGADVHKSKIEKIKMVFDEYKVGPRDCLFITDTLGDMREAREAGVDAVGVTWGWHPRETLEKGSPFAIVDTPEEIIGAVDRYFARA
ncbi:MAG: HAD hydrolase-like protein [Candidatus Colwellbacteria bacterium]|nr:HAD hydrolase-like protein [Candidatus Colwellbacteria bacterium]